MPIDRHAVVLDDLTRDGHLAVAAGLGGEIDDDRARAHALDRARGYELRGRTTRNRGGRDHDVEVGNPLLERRLLLRLLLGRELARVAAGRLLRANAEVEERRAEALHLLGDGRAHVERRDDRAEPPRGRDRLQAGDAGADDERPHRRDRPGGGHEHREEARHAVGGEHDRLVAGDRRLRREGVHRLRARDPRDRLHREGDDAMLAQPRDPLAGR